MATFMFTGKDRHHLRMQKKVAASSSEGATFKEWENELKTLASESTYIIDLYGKKPSFEKWQKVQEATLLTGIAVYYYEGYFWSMITFIILYSL